ncbi:hypothetical protein CDAR_301861 [Caerostris darwini]|uniref:Uncharacterized protein n=1 Tax=Caerostris darwini TaxID=1538125 RepID=A0AAV4VDL5_9ARAC|nr:hypothetical protein CDAR_301861 [Caerostris darwini]
MLNPNRCANKKAFLSGKMMAIKTHFSGVKRSVSDDGLLYRERAEEKIPNCVTFFPSQNALSVCNCNGRGKCFSSTSKRKKLFCISSHGAQRGLNYEIRIWRIRLRN